MQKLKELIYTGSDEEILDYVKGQFKDRIDPYIEMILETGQLKDDVERLAKESEARRLALDEYCRRVDVVLSRIEKSKPNDTFMRS